MRATFLLIVVLVFSFARGNQLVARQTTALTRYQITSLAVLGKVWGFLKYYHPNVAKGQYNWDSVLIAKIPVFVSEGNNQKLCEIVTAWLAELGTVPGCSQCDNLLANKLNWNLDTSWISNSGFDVELANKFRYILANRNQGENYYVTYGSSKQIKVIHEQPYLGSEFQFPSPAYRLLTLFRYWNIVNYFSPYKYIANTNWQQLLGELIPPFYEAKDTLQYHLSILEMVRALGDGHSALSWSPQLSKFFGSYQFVPFVCSIVEGKAVVALITNDSMCKLQGIGLNDVITAIDGEPVEKRINKYSPYVFNATNRDYQLQSLCSLYLFAGETGTCTITRLTRTGTNTLTIRRYNSPLPFSEPVSKSWAIVAGSIGYINMEQLLPKEVDGMMDSLSTTRGIIIDLRNYPRNTWRAVARRLCSGKFIMSKLSYPDLSFPGTFKYFPDQAEGIENNTPYKGKVVLLVNALSKSHSEFSIMGLQAATETITIGSPTAGADGDLTDWIMLPGGFRTKFSGLGVYYPDGTIAQKKGVNINIICKPTVNGILAGKDELLEAAIHVIMQDQFKHL